MCSLEKKKKKIRVCLVQGMYNNNNTLDLKKKAIGQRGSTNTETIKLE